MPHIINNKTFLKAIFGEDYQRVHVTSFLEDPSNIPADKKGRCWCGGAYSDVDLIPDSNQYFTVSLFRRDNYKANRRKDNFIACYVIGLDDVKEKLPLEQVERLPTPSIIVKTSLGSEQWLYILRIPETNQDRVDNLHDGLIANGLAPNSKDPGQKGVTRYLRLPEGVNTKQSRIDANRGMPPRCEVVEFNPDLKYSLEQLAAPFNVDLSMPRVPKRNKGAADIPDHPLLQTSAINIKKVNRAGNYDITCPWVDEHTGSADDGAAMFTNDNGTIGFKCHHGSCEHRTGKDLLIYIEKNDADFNEKYKNWQLLNSFKGVDTNQNANDDKTISAREKLQSMTANGMSEAMEKKMLEDKFILQDLAILGQWTVFFAGPGTGKTLITLWLLCESVTKGIINGKDVVYANCDDPYKAGVEKVKIAENIGFYMGLPGVNDFSPDALLQLMEKMVEQDEAHGVIIILDTLKKFTDTMNKQTASEFGKKARAFTSAGGSLICLAHVNKHKNSDGKSIYSGTADIRDDADCVYTIELVGEEPTLDGGDKFTIEFQNIKARGDIDPSLAFQYSRRKGASYLELLDSVKRVTGAEMYEAVLKSQDKIRRENDAETIELIKAALENGKKTKTEIETFIADISPLPRQKVRDTIERYVGQLWKKERIGKNGYSYSMLVAPLPPASPKKIDFF